MRRVMAGYQPEAELTALLDPEVRNALMQAGSLRSYHDLTEGIA